MNKNIMVCSMILIITGIFSGCISDPDSISGDSTWMNDSDEKSIQVDLDKQTIAQMVLGHSG